jgi:hypothetical protein
MEEVEAEEQKKEEDTKYEREFTANKGKRFKLLVD